MRYVKCPAHRLEKCKHLNVSYYRVPKKSNYIYLTVVKPSPLWGVELPWKNGITIKLTFPKCGIFHKRKNKATPVPKSLIIQLTQAQYIPFQIDLLSLNTIKSNLKKSVQIYIHLTHTLVLEATMKCINTKAKNKKPLKNQHGFKVFSSSFQLSQHLTYQQYDPFKDEFRLYTHIEELKA